MTPSVPQEASTSQQNRSTSAPPQAERSSTPRSPPPSFTSPAHKPSPLGLHPANSYPSNARYPAQIPTQTQASGSLRSIAGGKERRVLGIQLRLKKEVDGVVKRRSGGVLGRGFILKTDHYPTGRALDLDLEIQGAPNFRAPDEEGLNVFGVAQPTVPGLKSILTILGCQPDNLLPPLLPSSRRASSSLQRPSVQGSASGPAKLGAQLEKVLSQPQLARRISASAIALQDEGQAIWFSTREETLVYCNGRPYVLRDASTPFQTLNLSNRAGNLEDIETRLKQDILEEARKYGGMILVHDELENEHLVPTWMSVDERSIRTPEEVYEDVKEEGWRVGYHRIPIAPDTPIEDAYLDAYVSAIKDVDPLSTSLVFNCGMGVVRTTFAMVAASLLRRKQLLVRGYEDAFPKASSQSGIATPSSFANLPGSQQWQATQFLEQVAQQQVLTKSLLQLTQVLDRTLPSRHGTAVDLLTSQPTLLEELRKAHMGNYQIVLSLISSLDHGRQMKQLVDEVIDSCDAVVNLREIVVEYRIKYSASSMDDKTRSALLGRALRALEQYFDLIVFAAYVEEEEAGSTGVTFAAWLMNRPEIWNQIKSLRRQTGNRLAAFAPVNDLSQISKTSEHAEGNAGDRQHGRPRDLDLQGGKVLGDEWAEHVVSNRSGIMLRASTLLKSDLWTTDTAPSSEGVRGAIGFRQVTGSSIFTTGQPTQDALSLIVNVVKEKCTAVNTVFWICLREEPLVMINGSPYCLRRGSTLLRNMRDYSGVSASRLEMLEERLKSDVIAELGQFQGTVLLHTETSDGEVVPVWESVESGDVESIKDVMDSLADSTDGLKLVFFRVPVTSESSPDFHDISQLLDICMRTGLQNTAFILNDQLGRGRSSTTAIMLLLMQRWLRRGGHDDANYPPTPSRERGRSTGPGAGMRKIAGSGVLTGTSAGPGGPAPPQRASWQIINSCLRVIRNGVEVKRVVDEAVDAAAAHFNLRDTIQEFRLRAEETDDPEKKSGFVEKGLYHLRRYYYLLLFQAYLDDRKPDEEEPYSFESWVKHRPVFKTLETELEHGGLAGLTPIDRMELANGMALPDEVVQVVANRSGGILSAQTILKSDFFSGLQKQSLPDRVDGAANYRRVPLISATLRENDHFVYGTGMPSGPGLRNALVKMGAGPKGEKRIVWTSLREEPVLYIKTKPHVLRLVDKPVNNIETTGVTAAVVERMENTLKEDVLREIRAGEGKLLVHDEVETKPGTYEIIPIWETIEEKDIMTPRELYEEVIKEGYQVDYLRVAITDEQAPLPASLQVIVDRVARGLTSESDFVFNCQMGRGRTTTGMVAASLIATIEAGQTDMDNDEEDEEVWDGAEQGGIGAEEAQYLNGEYKTILQLVTVLRHGKQAKRLTDRAVDEMEGVQNLRKAVYDFKLKVDAAPAGSAKARPLVNQAVNYLYRYGTLIVLTNFLLEAKETGVSLDKADFPAWMQQHREIRSVLSRKTLD